MTGLILPPNGFNPAMETAKATIGGLELEYFVKPGVALQPNDLPGTAQLVSAYGGILHALMREAVAVQKRLDALEKQLEAKPAVDPEPSRLPFTK